LLARSETEARAGAKIILWPECSGGVTLVQEDEAILLARASALARTTGTYLDLGLCELLSHPVRSSFFTDEIILIEPTGSVVWRYQKAHPVPGEPWPAGDGQVPTVQTPYGRLANVVCFDADFPGTMRQAGQAGADLMLVPSKDWREIDPSHSQLITFRAIENGYSLVRQTSEGLAMTVDYEGNVLGASDYFTTDPQVMVAYVPMQGVRTIYATIGDLFAWLSIAGLVVLIGVAIARRRTAGKAVEAAPSGEALPVS
jgi:apolipoprotein N-acyltransferase